MNDGRGHALAGTHKSGIVAQSIDVVCGSRYARYGFAGRVFPMPATFERVDCRTAVYHIFCDKKGKRIVA